MIIKENVVTIIDPSHDVLTYCRTNLTMDNPKYQSNARMGVSNFNTPKLLKYYNWDEETNTLTVPIGFWQKNFHFMNTEDNRSEYSTEVTKSFKPITLRPEQELAVQQMLKFTNGILNAPTGAGKTVIALEMIRRLGQKTLFLVHTKDLARQFQDRIKSFFGYKAGLIGTGKFETTDIAVGILQTLVRLKDDQITKLNQTYGYVIGDEIHVVGADVYFEAMCKLNAKWKHGLSATPERQDGKTPLLIYATGPVRHSITFEEVKNELCFPKFEYVETEFYFPIFSSREYTTLLEHMSDDVERNKLIIDSRNRYPDKRAVILCQRQKHMETLSSLIPNSTFLHSGVSARDRKERLSGFFKGTYTTLVSSYKLLGTGIDNNKIDLLILAAPTNNKNDVKQSLGRTMRKTLGKESLIIDIIDSKIGMLLGMSKNRKKWYKEYIEMEKKINESDNN